jgi:hypothetical protein
MSDFHNRAMGRADPPETPTPLSMFQLAVFQELLLRHEEREPEIGFFQMPRNIGKTQTMLDLATALHHQEQIEHRKLTRAQFVQQATDAVYGSQQGRSANWMDRLKSYKQEGEERAEARTMIERDFGQKPPSQKKLSMEDLLAQPLIDKNLLKRMRLDTDS